MKPIFHSSPNYDAVEETRKINSIIIHYTETRTDEEALNILCDIHSKVSSHYLIYEDGTLLQLVEENNIAWHAGKSRFFNINHFNNNSIGIELVNPGHNHGYRDFTSQQYDTLVALCLQIMKNHPIIPKFILGHSDIAPQRKIDPGEKFNWRLLHSYGIGVLPPKNLISSLEAVTNTLYDDNDLISQIQNNLYLYGYDIETSGSVNSQFLRVLRAFHSHFYQENYDNVWDKNSTRILSWLNNKELP